MVDTRFGVGGGKRSFPAERKRAGRLARICLWLSLLAVGLVVVGLGGTAVVVLAHHVAPAGGGG